MSEVLGVLVAILVAMTMIPSLVKQQQASNETTRAVATAEQHREFIDASDQYIRQYSAAIQSASTPTTPAVITVDMLKAVALLPSGFSPTNSFGQTWQTHVLQPASGQLVALAMSTGGSAMTDLQGSKIASLVGSQGGFVPVNSSGSYPAGYAYGSFGGWTQSTTNYSAASGGRLAALLSFNGGQANSSYLYRNSVGGQTQLNTMNTPLILGDSTIVTVNASCSTNGAIARDSAGAVLSCQSGVWKKQGASGCVAFAGDLNGLQTDGCYNGFGLGNAPNTDWLFVEVLRHYNQGNFYTVQRATAMTSDGRGASGQVWIRTQQSNAPGQGWGPWRKQTGCNEFWGDLNGLQEDGCYNGNSLGNAPVGDWLFVEVLRHFNQGSYHTIQRATAMTGPSPGEIWVRSQQSGSWGAGWGAWKKLGGTKPPITDMCMVDAGNAEGQLLDALCQASCGQTSTGLWRAVGSWDVDRGVGVARKSIRVDEGINYINGGYMAALCAKVDF